MSDRIKGLFVSLSGDLRDEEASPIADAIRMIKGVAAVTCSVADSDDWMARSRIRHETQMKLYGAIDEIFTPKT